MGEGAAKRALPERSEHPGRRMGEGPELLPHQPEDEVLDSDDQAGNHVARRVAEHDDAASMLRRGSQQPLNASRMA